MHLTELYELIESGENDKTEFKRKFSAEDKIAKELIAFANSKGGKILFGVDDDGTVVGVESEKGEIELVDMAARFYCEPPVKYNSEIIHIFGKDVVIINIDESKTKPHRLLENGKPENSEKVYIRHNDKNILASKITIKVLKNSNPDSPPQIINIGDKEKFLIDYLEKHERITQEGFKKLLNLSNRRSGRILINLVRAGLIRQHTSETNDYFTKI
jgi:predicted HTH transcriptional regulator